MRFDSFDQKAHDAETIALDLDKIVNYRFYRYQVSLVSHAGGI